MKRSIACSLLSWTAVAVSPPNPDNVLRVRQDQPPNPPYRRMSHPQVTVPEGFTVELVAANRTSSSHRDVVRRSRDASDHREHRVNPRKPRASVVTG